MWRGVREDLSALCPKDKEFTWWAFSSCTASMSVLESPNYLGKSGARTIFSIQTNSGKHIRAHSYFENEDEILLPPGIYLRVIDVLSPADSLHIIQLREIPVPHEMLAKPFDLGKLEAELPKVKLLPQQKGPVVKEENEPTFVVDPNPLAKQKVYPPTIVNTKPPAKQENHLTPSAAPKAPVKQEYSSPASTSPKPSVAQTYAISGELSVFCLREKKHIPRKRVVLSHRSLRVIDFEKSHKVL